MLILTHGTRGDVQPFAALAHALHQAGHEAVLAAPAASASLAGRHDLPFLPLHDGPNTLLDEPEIREAIETNYRGLRGKRTALRVMRRSKPLMGRVVHDMAQAHREGADLVVHSVGIPGHHVAEKLGVPSVPVALQPVWVPTSAFPNPMLPLPLPAALNRASYWPIKMMLRSFAGVADTVREKELELPRRRGRHDPLRSPGGGPATMLQAFSPRLLPSDPGYPAWVHTTGFWYLPASTGWSPSPELAAFLDAGPPPVSIGFGSMAGTDPERVGRVVLEAVRLAGVRAILVSGWGGMKVADLPANVMLLDDAPHDWLFPRMAAVVHHGGGGTTGAALASGRPQVICPFVADQPFWAARVHAAGAAPEPQPQRRLTAHGLGEAIGQAVTDPRLAERARGLRETMRAEDGVTAAIKVLESVAVRR